MTKIPVIKKDAEVTVTLNHQEILAIVQSIFIISENWTKEDVEEMKTILQEGRSFTDPKRVTFILMDRLYRKILKTAQDLSLTEDTELPNPVVPDLNQKA